MPIYSKSCVKNCFRRATNYARLHTCKYKKFYFHTYVLIGFHFHRHKIFLIFPHILQTSNPPVPSHWIRQLPGKCVVTYPGAYHMVINAGKNIAEAINFADAEWTEKFSQKEILCNCELRKDIDELGSHFNFPKPSEKEAMEGSTGEGNSQPQLVSVPPDGIK